MKEEQDGQVAVSWVPGMFSLANGVPSGTLESQVVLEPRQSS